MIKQIHKDALLGEILTRTSETFRNEGRTNSYYRCRSTLHAIKQYTSGDDVPTHDLTPAWLRACEQYWISCGKSITTVSIYMKTIKSALGSAGMDSNDFPFGKGRYVIPRGSQRRMALTKEQLKLIMEFKGDSRLEECRDLWLFSYLCNGINFRDMIYLRYGNISNGEICFLRSKTRNSANRKPIRAALTPQMRDIIARIGNPDTGNPDTYIFRCCDGSTDDYRITMHVRKVVARCNRAMAQIAESLGIPRFSTYSARHSFASVLNWSGVDINYISESLGHSNLTITQNYLAGFTKEDRKRNAALLTDF